MLRGVDPDHSRGEIDDDHRAERRRQECVVEAHHRPHAAGSRRSLDRWDGHRPHLKDGPSTRSVKIRDVVPGRRLFDSMTVFENVAFPLREKLRLKGDVVTRRVEEKLEQVGLKGMGHKFPAELSGRMRKRAGLARARW